MTLSSIFGSSNGTFLSRRSYVFDGETKEPGYVRLLPTSDIVLKLFSELVRAARRTVESGISSLCDVTFRMGVGGGGGEGVKCVTLNQKIFSETLVPPKIFWWSTLHTIFIWEFGTTESSESPEECESSATYINPNRFLPGVRVVYKWGRVFRQSV